jgi:deoxyribodipyrimidine photo-lyase
VKTERVRELKPGDDTGKGPVLYWMSRDQRASDNWALIHAQAHALDRKAPLAVVFCLVPSFLGATVRQYDFMIRGLEEVCGKLREKGIPFYLLKGEPAQQIPSFAKKHKASALITDFDPLRIKRQWKNEVASALSIPLVEVDAHNIVPCWTASDKREYGAYTIRPKITRMLPRYLESFPRLKRHPFAWKEKVPSIHWDNTLSRIKLDRTVQEVSWIRPGEAAGRRKLRTFIQNRLEAYTEHSNDPNRRGQSDLSPYLHFGQISAQRVALEVQKKGQGPVVDDFLEELVVRRELSDNFCYYNKHYDRFSGFPNWAMQTLEQHRADERDYLYTSDDLEMARTHDNLWNAAQKQMVNTGKMHGYMRMYWAKKILQWSPSPEQAMEAAIFLNDRYELDGRDPNGYAGIAWSIGGVHDRAWGERPVFGKVRYMSEGGARRKFDVDLYIKNQMGS